MGLGLEVRHLRVGYDRADVLTDVSIVARPGGVRRTHGRDAPPVGPTDPRIRGSQCPSST